MIFSNKELIIIGALLGKTSYIETRNKIKKSKLNVFTDKEIKKEFDNSYIYNLYKKVNNEIKGE